jgi:Susd and RagB outer membrane lipoprotein
MIMNYKNMKLATLILVITVWSVGCVDKFEEINTDPTRPTLDDPAVAAVAANGLFSSAISKGLMEAFEFQRVQALYADLYGGHTATSISYFSSDKYAINEVWLNAGWNFFYPRDINNLVSIINSKYATNNQKQIARIWKVFLFHRMVDFYGDIPYSNAGNPAKPEVWDSQKDIYTDFFKELDEAAKALDLSVVKSFDNKDVIYQGNTAKWKAFANTLRLRLALRISKADPANAKIQAEAAASGVFTANSDNALAAVSTDLKNGLNQITEFNEFRMGAVSESLLLGYEDPRLPVYFSPVDAAGEAVYVGKYNGIMNGLSTAQLSESEGKFVNNSNLGSKFRKINEGTNPRIVLTYAEACFLLAEAKLNGWSVGGASVQEWYDKGVTASITQHGGTAATATTYLTSIKVPISPAFPTDYADKRPVSTLAPKFSTDATEQREQIGIQKWIAIFPDGFEAWAEYRRTGFPKLYAPVNYDASSDVPKGKTIQRIPYTAAYRALNKTGVEGAEARMGGGGQFVKLWFAGGK